MTAGDDAGAAAREHAVEQRIGRLLQGGVALAAAVVLVGAVALLARDGGRRAAFEHFAGEVPALRAVDRIAAGAIGGDPRAIVQLGLVLLIATPVARVAFTLVAFALQRDRLYVAITAIVLALLTWALLGGAV